jgi:hypothetical protein
MRNDPSPSKPVFNMAFLDLAHYLVNSDSAQLAKSGDGARLGF